MGKRTSERVRLRLRRHRRVRKKVHGTAERPRVVVFRSSRHIYAQVIDDTAGHTLVSAGTLDGAVRERLGEGDKKAAARVVGQVLAERARAKGIERVVFDRGGYLYHGRVRALAEGAREGGLEF